MKFLFYVLETAVVAFYLKYFLTAVRLKVGKHTVQVVSHQGKYIH